MIYPSGVQSLLTSKKHSIETAFATFPKIKSTCWNLHIFTKGWLITLIEFRNTGVLIVLPDVTALSWSSWWDKWFVYSISSALLAYKRDSPSYFSSGVRSLYDFIEMINSDDNDVILGWLIVFGNVTQCSHSPAKLIICKWCSCVPSSGDGEAVNVSSSCGHW